MGEFFALHPKNPERRWIKRAAEVLRAGGLIAYPTDSCYALGCHIGDVEALERMRRIRGADRHHFFTLVCSGLKEIGHYAQLDTRQFRIIKHAIPGPFTFLVPATRETPRRLQHPKRRMIGVRVPDHIVVQMLLEELGEPLMSSTLMLPGDEAPLTYGEEIRERLLGVLDLILDFGSCGSEPTTVVDLEANPAEVLRVGKGRLQDV